MNLSDMLITMSQASEIEQPGLFPFPFDLHVIFVCVATLFLAFQFYKERKPYQLIMCVAIPVSLAIWLSEDRTLFYGIGIIEAVLLLAAFVTSIIFRKKDTPEDEAAEAETPEKEAPAAEAETADEAATADVPDSENEES